MGEVLLKYYKHIKDVMGLPGQMKLAIETKIPSTVAATLPDTPENIKKFEDAIQKLTGKEAPKL